MHCKFETEWVFFETFQTIFVLNFWCTEYRHWYWHKWGISIPHWLTLNCVAKPFFEYQVNQLQEREGNSYSEILFRPGVKCTKVYFLMVFSLWLHYRFYSSGILGFKYTPSITKTCFLSEICQSVWKNSCVLEDILESQQRQLCLGRGRCKKLGDEMGGQIHIDPELKYLLWITFLIFFSTDQLELWSNMQSHWVA